MAKGMRKERKNVDGLDKDIKNMKGTVDPGEQYLYLYCRVVSDHSCCILFFLFFLFFIPIMVVSRILTSVRRAQRLNKCPDPPCLFNKTFDE